MNAIARAIVRVYPAAWRERYEDEVLALVDAGPVRLSDVCGLLRHCITERVLALYEPSRHITAYRVISGMALLAYIAVLFLVVLVVGSIPFVAGYAVQWFAGPFSADWVETIEWLAVPVFLLLFVPAWVKLFRLQMVHARTGTPLSPTAERLRWIVIGGYAGVWFFNGLVAEAPSQESFLPVMRSSVFLLMLWALPEDLEVVQWPGRGLFETLGRLRSARYDLRWARMELDRCEGVYSGREPGPDLRAARAEMERLSTAEANAMAELDAMGYHARFTARTVSTP